MSKLTIDDLYTLEAYAKIRPKFRTQVLDHKRHRKLALGEHVTLLFEDRLTMQYQIQEMLRVERIFEEPAIIDELNAYNPLIPDGHNWKATMLIEYSDEGERRAALSRLLGIERGIWVKCGSSERIFAIADEDLERSREDKTSSVHFLRFELSEDRIAALKNGAELMLGVEHPDYTATVTAPQALRESLIADLD